MNPRTGAVIIGIGVFFLLLLNVRWAEVSAMVRAYTVLAMGIVSIAAFAAVQGSEGEGVEIGTEIGYHVASGIAAAIIVGSLFAYLGGFPFWSGIDWSDQASEDFRLESQVLTEEKAKVIVNETSMEIEVITWDRPEVSANGTIKVYGSSQEKAEEFLNQTRVQLTREMEDGMPVFRVMVEGPERGTAGYRGRSLVLTVMVPEESVLDLSLRSVSGKMVLRGPTMSRGDLRGTSGDIVLDSVEAETLDLSVVSGDITGELECGSARVKTVSGRIDISIGRRTGGYELSSTSGSVICGVPEDEDIGFSLEGSTTSGIVDFPVAGLDLTIDRDRRKEGRTPGYESKEIRISISGSTISGDVRVVGAGS